MTVRIYRSTDASAPVLTGSAGALITVLDAILVNGYGALAAAGWTKPLSTTNKAAYKQNLTGANNASGMYLYVDDTGPGAGTGKEARVAGFETMSAITPTGTGQFPTAAQSTIGVGCLVVRKSTTADATARAWTCIANGQTIYFFTETADSTSPLATCTFCFGDFKSYKASDSYAVMIIGRATENSGSAAQDALHALNIPTANNNIPSLGTTMYGHFVARHWTGTGGSIRVGKPSDISRAAANVVNSNYGSYVSEVQTNSTSASTQVAVGRTSNANQWPAPNGPDGALALCPMWIGHSYALRGYLAGLWNTLHDRPLSHNDTFSVTGGNLNGKSFIAQNIQAYILGSANADNGVVIAETSDTWS